MQRQGMPAAHERSFEIALGRLQQAAAARPHDQWPWCAEPLAGLLEPVELGASLLEIADGHERLDRELSGGVEARLTRTACLEAADERCKLLRCGGVVASG